MSNSDDFSVENSEDLIANLKSGKPSEFEQLRSALNLLAHVTELAPTSVPPVLPSGITQPVPLVPFKSNKPRRTIVTSVVVLGMFASVSLAAAAVTGVGPTPLVNIGHQTARFVKSVAGAVSHVVTGGTQDSTETSPTVSPTPGLTPAPTGSQESSSDNNGESDSESLNISIPAIPNPLTPQARQSSGGKDGKSKDERNASGKEGKSNSNETQSPNSDESLSITIAPIATDAPSPRVEKEHTDSEGQRSPESLQSLSLPTAIASPNSSDQSSDDE